MRLFVPLHLCRDCETLDDVMAPACPACGSRRRVAHDELDTLDIAHIDCDAFYASVEKRDNPALIDKPVIVGGTSGRGVVTTACYVARAYGPRSAMPMFKALELCPDAVVIKPDMAKYKAVSQSIRAIFSEISDAIEPVSLDEAYLDLTPTARPSGTAHLSPAQALVRAQKRIENTVGITVSVGLSANKFLAKLASELDKPRGFAVIGRAEARDLIAAFPVGKIHGVGRATAERMAAMGFELIADLQALSQPALVARFGKFGARLHQFVNGEDHRRVTPDRDTKSVSAETTFRVDLRRFEDLSLHADQLAMRVAERLERAKLGGQTVVLKLKTADFQQLTRNRRLARPTQDGAVIMAAVATLLAREVDGRAFRLIGVGVADVTENIGAETPDLFSSLKT